MGEEMSIWWKKKLFDKRTLVFVEGCVVGGKQHANIPPMHPVK